MQLRCNQITLGRQYRGQYKCIFFTRKSGAICQLSPRMGKFCHLFLFGFRVKQALGYLPKPHTNEGRIQEHLLVDRRQNTLVLIRQLTYLNGRLFLITKPLRRLESFLGVVGNVAISLCIRIFILYLPQCEKGISLLVGKVISGLEFPYFV